MNIKELKALNNQQLVRELASLREQARDLRFRIHSQEVKNNHTMKKVRKDIARILTVLNQPKGK